MINCNPSFPIKIKDFLETTPWDTANEKDLVEIFQETLKNIDAITSVHRKSLLQKINSLIPKKSKARKLAVKILLEVGLDPEERLLTDQLIERENQDEILEELELIIPLFDDAASDSALIPKIFSQINSWPSEQRREIIFAMDGLPDEQKNPQDILNLLHQLHEIPDNTQRTEFIISKIKKQFQDMIEGVSNGYQRAGIIGAIAAIPKKERSDVVDKAKSMIEGISNGYERAGIIRIIAAIPKDD